ncbi:proline iminopeptidase [Ophiostoma piceae UAMH 11346]|uniref:Proline iminopeptidase n=1 Tax=Ophiostoma piceae (strain UAMH 11346) TaxID=1262450 RepID=S3C3J2_OPHP1|nr:proline iminopeptidase [Ophiostoma piceae UAMH 11346]
MGANYLDSAGLGQGIAVPAHARAASSKAIQPEPAVFVSCSVHRLPSQLLVAELFFDVPLDYADPDGEKIRLFARAAFRHEKPIVPLYPFNEEKEASRGSSGDGSKSLIGGSVSGISPQALRDLFSKPWMAYCEGGPGMGNREPQDYPFLRQLLVRGYQMLFLDYRGTGMSSPISAATLKQRGSPQAQANYLALFRADNIVRDLEAVRKWLTVDLVPHKRKWSIMGQSFGGFVSLTYLSFYSESLRESFITGGMAPVNMTPDVVYRATYTKAKKRNEAYFKKYPEDVQTLRQINTFLNNQPTGGEVPLPSGGVLTMHRVMTFGYMFGFHSGLDSTHSLLLRMRTDIERFGILTRPTLVAIEQFFPLDVAPMYGLVHEAIYCYSKGVASSWAAMRVGREFPEFSWVDHQTTAKIAPEKVGTEFLFSGEMIYPFMFDTFPELMEIKEAAHLLAERTEWDDLYDEAQLKQNTVPVYAATYIDDLYVDYGLAKETASKIGNVRMYETNGLYHNAARARSEEVMTQLFRLRDDPID